MEEQLIITYNRLYEENRLLLLNRAYKRIGDYYEAQDILHETFCALWNNKLVMSNEKYARAWLLHVCDRRIVDYFRDKYIHCVDVVPSTLQMRMMEMAGDDNIERWIESVEHEELLHYAWDRLSKKDERKYRMLLDMTYATNMTVEEMAAKHGVTKATFCKNVERARKYMEKTKNVYQEELRKKFQYVYD